MTLSLCLASQSPRRRELLAWLWPAFAVGNAAVDETPLPGETPLQTALRLAQHKALAFTAAANGDFVLAADTVVELTGTALGKPADDVEARAMLTALRGREHTVHTAIALRTPPGRLHTRYVTTQVWMRAYGDAEIQTYITSGDPFDKAGAYAIQHAAFNPVARLKRCYANVVGLPLCAVTMLLATAGYLHAHNLLTICERRFAYRCPAPDGGLSL